MGWGSAWRWAGRWGGKCVWGHDYRGCNVIGDNKFFQGGTNVDNILVIGWGTNVITGGPPCQR